jgi:hypothetical protein
VDRKAVVLMACTPDFLRGVAVAHIVGIMANAHEAGTWALVDVNTYNRMSTLTFKVGTIYPESTTDDRQEVRITVEEVP